MKKIFVYIGSLSNNSTTKKIVNKIIEKLELENKKSIHVDIYSGRNNNVKNCISCGMCFKTGICSLDEEDDMKFIKKKLIEADFIIFASPVFAHNVSGSMKTFIDRISYWTHILRLVGKDSYVISTASNNGSKFVLEYMDTFLTNIGTNVVGGKNFNILDRQFFKFNETNLKEIEEISRLINKRLELSVKESNHKLENLYKATKIDKNKILDNKDIVDNVNFDKYGFEFIYYRDSGMNEYDTLQEYLNYVY